MIFTIFDFCIHNLDIKSLFMHFAQSLVQECSREVDLHSLFHFVSLQYELDFPTKLEFYINLSNWVCWIHNPIFLEDGLV
jgi:hypothetical protein